MWLAFNQRPPRKMPHEQKNTQSRIRPGADRAPNTVVTDAHLRAHHVSRWGSRSRNVARPGHLHRKWTQLSRPGAPAHHCACREVAVKTRTKAPSLRHRRITRLPRPSWSRPLTSPLRDRTAASLRRSRCGCQGWRHFELIITTQYLKPHQQKTHTLTKSFPVLNRIHLFLRQVIQSLY